MEEGLNEVREIGLGGYMCVCVWGGGAEEKERQKGVGRRT